MVNTKNFGIIKCIKVDIDLNNLYYGGMKKVFLCSLLLISSQLMAEELRLDIRPNEYILYSNDKMTIDVDCVRSNFEDYPLKIKNKDGISIKELIVDNKSVKINRLLNDKNSIFYIHNGIAYIKNPELKTKEILISHGIYKGDKLNQKWNLWSYSFESKGIKECFKKIEVKKEEVVKPEKLKKNVVVEEKIKDKVIPQEKNKKTEVEKKPSQEVKEIEKKAVSSTKKEEAKELPLVIPKINKEEKNAPAIKNDAVRIFNNGNIKVEPKKEAPQEQGKQVEVKKEVPEVVKIIGNESKKKEISQLENIKPVLKDKSDLDKKDKQGKHAINVANKIKLPPHVRYCVLEETEKLVYKKFPDYEMTEFEKDPKFQEHMDESIIKALEICSKKK